MKKFIILFALVTAVSTTSFSQNINGRFSSSIYSFERFDTVQVSNNYVRSYQMLNLNISEGKFSLRSYLNFENDLSKEVKDDPRLRFYNLYLEGRDLGGVVSFKLGRQPLYNSVAGGLFDGINLDLKYDDYKLTTYYGGNVPAYQKLELTESWEDDYILGGRLSTKVLKNTQISLSYINKNFKAQEYWALRYDPDLNPINVLISNKSNQYQFASAEVDYRMKDLFSVNTRFDYDINYEKASKFEIFGTYDQIEDLELNAYYNYREPRIRYNSIFSVFDFGNSQEIEFGGSYKFYKQFRFIGKYGNVIYKDDNSQRITAGISSNYGNVTYRKSFGYAGEQDAISLYTAYSFIDGVLTPSIGFSYTSYKLTEDSEKNNLTSLLAGFNLRPWRMLSLDVQGQYMNNKIYQDDFRIFFKLNYWFNTNLNLM